MTEDAADEPEFCTYVAADVCEILKERLDGVELDLPQSLAEHRQRLEESRERDNSALTVRAEAQIKRNTIHLSDGAQDVLAFKGTDVIIATGAGKRFFKGDGPLEDYADHFIVYADEGMDAEILDFDAKDQLTLRFDEDVTGLSVPELLKKSGVKVKKEDFIEYKDIAARRLQVSGDTHAGEAIITLRQFPLMIGEAWLTRHESKVASCIATRDVQLDALGTTYFENRDAVLTQKLAQNGTVDYAAVQESAQDELAGLLADYQQDVANTHDSATQCAQNARRTERSAPSF